MDVPVRKNLTGFFCCPRGEIGKHTALRTLVLRVRVPSWVPFLIKMLIGWIAQLVEHQTENLSVAGSIPAPPTNLK